MTIVINEDLKLFTEQHDRYLANWGEAMKTGETNQIEQMSPEYYVTFFSDSQKEPTFYPYKEAMDGMRQSVKECIGFVKHFENRIIRMKNDKAAIVFYELVLTKGSKELSRMFTTEEWRYTNDSWSIEREVDLIVK